MLLSMTGFGEASRRSDGVTMAIEVRTINSRYFKLGIRAPEGYTSIEPLVEAVVRTAIRRGTVQVQLRIERAPSADDLRIDQDVLINYRRQLEGVCDQWTDAGPVRIDALLTLPGVVVDMSCRNVNVERDWPLIKEGLDEALAQLMRMRAQEGAATAADLEANCQTVIDRLEQIKQRAPAVIDGYRQRLAERVSRALEGFQVSLDPADLVREVSLFCDRSDVSEELVRLKSHVQQFREIMARAESSGRNLEFLAQEMFRESNTIGAKANDVEISRHVVDLKAAIERIREQVQNIE